MTPDNPQELLKSSRPESREHKRIRDEISKLRRELEVYQLICNNIENGVTFIDEQGYIVYLSEAYGRLLGIDPKEQIGKHVTEVIENTRLHIAIRTGKHEIMHTQRIKGRDMIVQRIPIKKNGNIVGAVGHVIFKDIKELTNLAKKLSLLESKVKAYEEELISLRGTRYTFDSIVGNSEAIARLKGEALQAASNSLPVLLLGESGTGKELFAQAIHHASTRRIQPFVRINCSAIPKDLLESELFGYEKGAFTGAREQGKPGKLELAHRGTVFLDEIGDLPFEMQPKLLRAVEEREFERIGSNKVIRRDFRIIAATNQDLEAMIRAGRFRQDLYYRLNVIPLHIPPLRERREDIITLARHHLKVLAVEASLGAIAIDRRAEEALQDYSWSGNVRELFNVIERTVADLRKDTIHSCDLPFYIYRKGRDFGSSKGDTSLRRVQGSAEKEAIRYALETSGYNKAQAAKMLGIHRTLLYKKIQKYNLPLKPESVPESRSV